uniref:Secreted protein n=1 Tax=Sus scrofa TaxID=9823 RepID=A0A5G2QGU3_PIG
MLFPALLAMQGIMGALYRVVITSLGLLSGPLCDMGSGNYSYPFRTASLENSYLFTQPTWATCREPEHIVPWTVVVEAALCRSRVVSGPCLVFCGTCVQKRQILLKDFYESHKHLQMLVSAGVLEPILGRSQGTTVCIFPRSAVKTRSSKSPVTMSTPSAPSNYLF